jgi:hypothetical protein
VRWDQSLTRRQRAILLALALSVVLVISLLAWSVWSTLGAAASSPLPTPPPTLSPSPTPMPTGVVSPTVSSAFAPTPSPSPTPAEVFDVFRAGIISANVADARDVRVRLDTPLTLVDEFDMTRAIYTHFKAEPPLPIRMALALEALKLGNGEPSQVDVVKQAHSVASLYAPETSELFLRRDWDGSIATIERQLAYGYARAFADYYGDLAALRADAGSLDQQVALAAVGEGDAVVSAWLTNADVPSDPGNPSGAAAAIWSDIADTVCPQWRADESDLWQALSCLDLDLGVPFAVAHFRDGGTEAMDTVVLRPPRSTEQILHPDRYAEGDEPLVLLPIEPALGAGWTLTGTETLGEALMGLVVSSWSKGTVGAEAVAGWGGDLLQVWEGPERSSVVAWQMDWDESRTASLFHGQLLDVMPRPLVRGLIRDTTPPASLTRGRWWSGGQGTVFLYRRANHVWLVWGDTPEAVEAVAVAALP